VRFATLKRTIIRKQTLLRLLPQPNLAKVRSKRAFRYAQAHDNKKTNPMWLLPQPNLAKVRSKRAFRYAQAHDNKKTNPMWLLPQPNLAKVRSKRAFRYAQAHDNKKKKPYVVVATAEPCEGSIQACVSLRSSAR